MFFYIALIAWIGGVAASFANRNRRLPSIVLLLGLVLVGLTIVGKAGYFDLAGIAILAAIIWIANETDIKNAERNIMVKAVCCVVSAFVVLGFCLKYFLSSPTYYPLPIPNESDVQGKSDYFEWDILDTLRQLPFIISPLVSVALLLLALRLWRQLRTRRRERITHEANDG